MSLPDTSSAGAASAPGLAPRHRVRLLARLAVAGLLSGALAGCFQPLYADHATVGGPGLQQKLADVEVMQIQGRLGNDLRNELIYMLAGGAGNPKGAPLQIFIAADASASTALVNSSSGLPENMIIRVAANWRMVRADDDKKRPVAGGTAVGTASIDVSDQRFANYSAKNDAESRAARQVAEQIKAQLAAYFLRLGNEPPKPETTKTPGS
ncbi:LPS assembly lipoprotein LptE [Xanthobacter sp. V4C-4]|uniref:LPS assembly lipoprotein LptE n=1 Tax=Xanthobacter cornucopiae TaxID=3119924 RepID=UPI00372C0527